MADTINVKVVKDDGWKAVKVGPSTGVFSCGTSYQFCQSATPPTVDFIGHRVGNADMIAYSVNTETLYVKCDNGVVVLTED